MVMEKYVDRGLSDWIGGGLTVEVNGEGKRSVVWNSYEGVRWSMWWVSQKGHGLILILRGIKVD